VARISRAIRRQQRRKEGSGCACSPYQGLPTELSHTPTTTLPAALLVDIARALPVCHMGTILVSAFSMVEQSSISQASHLLNTRCLLPQRRRTCAGAHTFPTAAALQAGADASSRHARGRDSAAATGGGTCLPLRYASTFLTHYAYTTRARP